MGSLMDRNCYTGNDVNADRVRAGGKPVAMSAPDPRNFRIVTLKQCGYALVAMVEYPNCTNFEGKKILVYHGVGADELKKAEVLDPHFSDDFKDEFKLPLVARCLPTIGGWKMAVEFAGRIGAFEPVKRKYDMEICKEDVLNKFESHPALAGSLNLMFNSFEELWHNVEPGQGCVGPRYDENGNFIDIEDSLERGRHLSNMVLGIDESKRPIDVISNNTDSVVENDSGVSSVVLDAYDFSGMADSKRDNLIHAWADVAGEIVNGGVPDLPDGEVCLDDCDDRLLRVCLKVANENPEWSNDRVKKVAEMVISLADECKGKV